MRIVLRSALDESRAARLVDLAARFDAEIELQRGDDRAKVAQIGAVLSLGAEEGDEIAIVAVGAHAEHALLAIGALVDGDFRGDLAPELGSAEVEGIAVGRAIVWARAPEPAYEGGTVAEERARLIRAVAWAIAGVEELVRLLPPSEAELFAPEIAILEELRPMILARVDQGVRAEHAVEEATATAPTDLLVDARARLLDALAQDERSVERLLQDRDGDRILVTDNLAPSVVASLPARVVGIVAASAESEASGPVSASHAAILARSRDIPLAFVSPRAAEAIADDDSVVVDTTGACAFVWTSPNAALVEAARQRRRTWNVARAEQEEIVTAPLERLGLEVHINIGSLREHVPTSADGVGLVRTELIFVNHTHAPTETEQLGALRAIAARAGEKPVVARLFDAGADKPLRWLRPSSAAPDARGIELLLANPALIDTQLRVITRAAERADVRALLPFVNSASEIERVRARAGRPLLIGAMVETPTAVERIDSIAEAADFVCIGTNDLSAIVTGQSRSVSTLSLDAELLRLIERTVDAAHARGRHVCACGEMAGDPQGARILVGLGVDAISVAPNRFAKVKVALRDLSKEDCRGVAREAMKA